MRRFHKLRVPATGHPLVIKLFKEMNHQQIGIMDMADRTGIARETFKGWRTRHCPRITDLEACFNVLGYRLTVQATE